MTTKEMIEVMAAFERGEKIECKTKALGDGWDPVGAPVWNWSSCDYRVAPKPEPKPFKLPDGMFWVRFAAARQGVARLCLIVDTEAQEATFSTRSGLGSDFYRVKFTNLAKKYHWSRNRKTWFDFTGEIVEAGE